MVPISLIIFIPSEGIAGRLDDGAAVEGGRVEEGGEVCGSIGGSARAVKRKAGRDGPALKKRRIEEPE